MKNSQGTNLKQVSGTGQKLRTRVSPRTHAHTHTHTHIHTHTHTHTLFFIKGLYLWGCNEKSTFGGVVLCFFPQRQWSAESHSLSSQHPLSSRVCQLCQDRVSPAASVGPRLWSKASTDPGCNRKQIQPESPSSRNMLSTGKRLTFQKHELCKKKKRRKLRQKRNSTWSFASAVCRQRRGGRGVRSVQSMILSISASAHNRPASYCWVAALWGKKWEWRATTPATGS